MEKMTGEFYKTLRQGLGMSQADAMYLHGVKNIRTIKRWEAGESEISERAAERMLKAFSFVENLVEHYEDQAKKYYREADNLPVVLLTYKPQDFEDLMPFFQENSLPQTLYKTVVAWTAAALSKQNIPVNVIEMDKENYHGWLEGRKDTEGQRLWWAYQRMKSV